jgi:hypothetical protein
MINYPDGFKESELQLYIAAFKRCRELIEEKENQTTVAETVDAIVGQWGPVVGDAEKLRKFLLAEVKVPINPVSVIADTAVKDKKWFTTLKTEKGHLLEYWRRYSDYLNHKPLWTLDAVADIDESTDAVLNFMVDPSLGIKQDVYGLVFGYVQSGKTAHYLGVLNKATDAGYKIIIVLAGIHNNLRSQTQIRLEEEFLGYDVRGAADDSQSAIGVGVGQSVSYHLQALTSREEKGDFNKIKAGTSMNPPFVVVTKKNASVLSQLIKYISNLPVATTDDKGKRHFSAEYPLLVIDDEADQASLNTKDCYNADGTLKDDFNPTTINKHIRGLLGLFECYSYVGYTATPFANIFIPPKMESTKYGKDLFPKDFIVNIPRPKNYIGALEYFGLTDGDDEIKAMPLFREIDKGKDYLGKGTKKDDPVGAIPDDLKKALKTFVISVAVRNLRGQYANPNSMLIHIVRFKGQQNIIKRKVEKYFNEEIYNFIKNGDLGIEKELRELWEADYEVTTASMKADFSQYIGRLAPIEWSAVYQEIVRFIKAKEFTIYSINGDSSDTLIYENHKGEPFNVIVIGGDKLSRGLTLEGLIVSYFTRSSNTYDTLMQMGRWFGYRPGYLDLCRLYTTKVLYGYFVDISRATEDLVRQIDYMGNVVKQTPMEFGLGVESNPDLLITNRNKLRTGQKMKRDFSAHLSQTRILDIDAGQFNENFSAVENLIYTMGAPASESDIASRVYRRIGKHFYWFDVSGYDVAQFLETYKTSASATRTNSKYMSDYIKNQITVGGLTNWTVCLINYEAKDRSPFDIAMLKDVGAGLTRVISQFTDGDVTCDIHTLLSKDQEYLDYLSDEKFKEMQAAGKRAEEIRRKTRTRDHGLLLLYPIGNVAPITEKMDRTGSKTPFAIAVVFPDREGKGNIKSYHVNDIAVENKSYDFDA